MITFKIFLIQNFVKKADMKIFFSLLVVTIATFLLVTGNHITNKFSLSLHPNSFVNNLIKYQLLAMVIAILVTIVILKLNPESKQFLKIGQLNVLADKEKWLGINGKSTWKLNALQLLFFVSMATGVIMFLAVKYTNSIHNFQWSFIPLILLFSFTNSLAEELIFRFGIVGGLINHHPKLTILILSSVLFGAPHYFGWPSGFSGVLMASILGYILCKATLETKGLSIAWVIHFVQDLIIFTALLMMNFKR